MNGQWVEVFRAGRHTDSAGHAREWREEDLDEIVSRYDPARHEAPVVVGHPTDNAPAFGWVESLKREGKTLLAKFREVMPEFEEMVKAGRYKKRSISLYPDLTLRHVGFLGAMPPAVKGLADIRFSADDQAVTIDFSDDGRLSIVGGVLRRLREWIIGMSGAEAADRVVGEWEIASLIAPPEEADQPMTDETTFREEEEMAQIEELRAELAQEREKIAAFAEQVAQLTDENRKLREETTALRREAREREFAEFCDGLATRITPAMRPAVIAQMHLLADAPPVEFSEGGETVTRAPLTLYQESLRALPEVVSLSEVATMARAGEAAGDDSPAALAARAREYVEEMRGKGVRLSYAEAVRQLKDRDR